MTNEHPEPTTDAADTQPVTVSIARRVRPGREADYEAWVSGISQAASTFPGHLSVAVLRPSAATKGDYVIIYRFDTYAHCRVWEESGERAGWIARLGDIVEGDGSGAVKRVTGLEFWFDLPEVPAAAQPSKHKMAVVLTVVVFLILVVLNWALGPLLANVPTLARTFIIVVLQVGLLTYVIMPRVTRLLRGWLFKS